MIRPKPQFKAHIRLTFEEHGPDRRRKFGFDESGHRRLPMSMDGVEGLHTVGLWIEKKEAVFQEGDEFDADCCVIWPEGFVKIVAPGVQFKLWDSGFFARGSVTERCESGWESRS
jgi:hypothetical protein